MPAGPGNEDVGVISSRFFLPKGKFKVIQFHPNKVLELSGQEHRYSLC